MIPVPFRYLLAGTADHAVELLGQHGDDARVIAGGQSLLPLMKLRLASPSVVIDLAATGLTGIDIGNDGTTLVIGAMTTYRDVVRSPLVASHAPLLARAASLVGDPQVRNRGTLGGGVAHANPACDVAGALVALGASVTIQGPSGTRSLGIEDFLVGFWTNAMAADEVLVAVRVPSAVGVAWAYEKFAIRAQDWALVAVAVAGSRVALLSMGDRIVRAHMTEEAFAGGASAADAAALADMGTHPLEDLRGSSDYRRHLARVLTERALVASAQKAFSTPAQNTTQNTTG